MRNMVFASPFERSLAPLIYLICYLLFFILVEALLDELDTHTKGVQPPPAVQSANDQHNAATRTGQVNTILLL